MYQWRDQETQETMLCVITLGHEAIHVPPCVITLGHEAILAPLCVITLTPACVKNYE